MISCSLRCVSAVSCGSAMPCFSACSIMSVPEPPEIEYMHTLGPVFFASFANNVAVSSSSSRSPTRVTACCANNPFTTASLPVRWPVCDVAMRAPASVSPIFSITTGLSFSFAACNATRSRSADLKPSTYAPITCVSSSYAKYSRKSPSSRSTSLPVGTHREKPAPNSAPWTMGRPLWPLWVSKPILPPRLPGASGIGSNAFVLVLGPNTRMPHFFARAPRSRSIAAPSGPTSLKPDVKTSAYLMPFSPSWSMIDGTAAGLTLTTASSISAGMSTTDG